MIDERFIFFGIALNIIGTISYLIDTLKGKVKPNKVTWFLWALAPLIAFSAEISQGVGLAVWMTFIVGFNPLLVFLASFVNKKAVWKINTLDVLCGLVSVAGLILWYLTKVGNIAIVFSILADLTAAIPTVVKSYKAPETENSSVFILSGISALITLFAIKTWNFAHYAFPLYIFIICLVLTILIKFKFGNYVRARIGD